MEASPHVQQRQAAVPVRQTESVARLGSVPASLPGPSPLLQRALARPGALSTGDISYLQRTIGNQAVCRLLAGSRSAQRKPQTPVQPSAAGPQQAKTAGPVAQRSGGPVLPIQRRIGFEIETGIPIMQKQPGQNLYHPLNNDDLESAVNGGKLMVDHIPNHPNTLIEPFNEWNIVEFVTNPVNEGLTDQAFRAQAMQWIQFLQNLRDYAQGHFIHFDTAPGVGAAKEPNIFIGLRPPAGAYGAWNRVAPQATMGIKLKKVGQVFGAAQAGGFGGHVRHDRVSEGAHRAEPAAQTVMTTLLADYPPTWGRRKGVNSLRGLLTLLANYLLTGHATRGKGGYLKNMSLFMYKSKLSSVRNDVVQEYYGEKILSRYPARRTRVRNLLLQATNRPPNEDVFDGAALNGAPVLCQAWLDEVLTGTDDSMFESMKNPWSNEIAPENVGNKHAAVMEMRDISAYQGGGLGLTLNDAAGLADYLVAVYRLNRSWSQ